MADDADWFVQVTDEAKGDLNRLKKRRRKIWRDATTLIKSLELDPWVGDSCDPPLDNVRRVHFARDKYRLAWLVVEELRRVDVLAVDRKTPVFYDRVLVRLRDIRRPR